MKHRPLNVFICFFIICNLAILLTGNAIVYKVLFYNLASIDDYKIFPNRVIRASSVPKAWKFSLRHRQNKLSTECSLLLSKTQTVSVLMVKHDSIIYENYSEGYGPASYVNSFSMAKSFVSTLVGVAIAEGLITNINQPVCSFLPEFKTGQKSKITIKHLLTMSSGLNWVESYTNPFSTVSKTYYGADLEQTIAKLEVVDVPGTIFKYKGGDTQILAFILQKITGENLSNLLQQKLWNPLGSSQQALWSLDHENGNEKASCCLHSNARDYALLGKLYLNKGKIDGKQVIPLSYLAESIKGNGLTDQSGNIVDYYGYQWWVIPQYKGHKVFYARGVGGQYIIVVPDESLVIVRLGRKRGNLVGKHFEEIFQLIDEAIRL